MPEHGNAPEAPRRLRTGRRRWLFALASAIFLSAGYFAAEGLWAPTARRAAASRGRVLYYVDPMHTSYRSDSPGRAPDCGMELKPVYETGAPNQTPGAQAKNAIFLTPEQERAAQFETETVEEAPFARELKTSGRVAPDEALAFTVSAGVDGWVRATFSDRTGTRVKGGEILASFYSKEISAPQQAYLYALESNERLRRTSPAAAEPLALAEQQLTTAHDNLQFLGMGEAQIDELARTRREMYEVALTAPGDGLILERAVAVGKRFMKGESLYRIAGLAHVWVLADINSEDAPFGGVLTGAHIEPPGLPPIEARVSPVPPQFRDEGRTGKLRLEVENAREGLLPGMIVDVVLLYAPRTAVTAHADALIDSGTRQSVFVAHGGGKYELREVRAGAQQGDRVEILSGLKPGERIVTAGAFLLDSESRLKDMDRAVQ